MNKSLSYRLIFGYLGIFLIFIGATCLVPLILLLFYPNEANYWINFFIPGIGSIIIGSLLTILLKGCKKARLGKHQDSVLLVLIWLFAINICAIPFFIREDMSFTQAVFETTSGFSTIGLTVYKDFDCHIFVFYRSLLTLIGGVGLVLIISSAISDKYGLRLSSAEGHNDQFLPNLKKSAAVILLIYMGIIALGTIAYCIAGVPLFDAIVHSISAVATGGFSSKAGGLIDLPGNFTAIQIISIVLMVLGATNFLTHFLILTGRGKQAIKDCELILFGFMTLILIPLFFVSTIVNGGFSGFEAFKASTFTYFSAVTTTGFSNVSDITQLGQSTMLLIIFVNIIGGGMGSTAGGVKQYRIAVTIKSFYWSAQYRFGNPRMIYPHYVYRSGKRKEILPSDALEAFGYLGLYLFVMFVGSLLVTLFSGWSFGDSLFEFSNAISSTGLSNGLTAACSNNNPVLWVMILAMFAGRLEMLAIYFAAYRVIRDILGKETV